MRKYFSIILLGLAWAAISVTALASPVVQPWVVSFKSAAPPGANQAGAMGVSVTLLRAAILNRKFFYEVGFQTGTGALNSNAGLPLGIAPALFQLKSGELDLMTDPSVTSDQLTSLPNGVINRFKILKSDTTTITIESSSADSMILTEILGRQPAPPAKKSWLRNAYVQESGALWLQEASVVLPSGDVAEVLESIYPADFVSTGADFERIPLDPSAPLGRYTYLSLPAGPPNGGGIHTTLAGKSVVYAWHFDISDNANIDFYAAASVPAKLLPAVGSAIEGYNRYFKNFKDVNRAVIRFRGYLPAGVVPCDPRFNIVTYVDIDSDNAASNDIAAPESGKIIHSNITFTRGDIDTYQNEAKLAIYAELALDPSRVQNYISDRTLSRLKSGSLFHEMGHALGFSHNRKSSAMIDLAQGAHPTQTKILSAMDEVPADFSDFFDSVSSAEGPVLEWDRQLLSVLYNHGRDVDFSQPALPVCYNPGPGPLEASTGIDPLCLAYDVGSHPWQAVDLGFNRWTRPHLKNWSTAYEAVGNALRLSLSEEKVAAISDPGRFHQAVLDMGEAFAGALEYFSTVSNLSPGGTSSYVLANLLKTYKPGIVSVGGPAGWPAKWNEAQVHETALAKLKQILGMNKIPDSLKSELRRQLAKAQILLAKCTYLQAQSVAQRQVILNQATRSIEQRILQLENKSGPGLSRTRAMALANLSSFATPYYIEHRADGKMVDFKKVLIDILVDALLKTGELRDKERSSAAGSLVTFAGDNYGDLAIAKVSDSLSRELNSSSETARQTFLKSLIAILTTKANSKVM